MKYTIKAAILDLDGVITKTAEQHARAWKVAFDDYNRLRRNSDKETYKPFSIEEDYPKLVDGIPRYDGVSRFLESRSINLPFGSPEDKAGKETICGLGNLKNELFQQVIQEEGVHVFEKNVEVVREWRDLGLKTAIISSSKNCRQILQATGLEELFDVRVDGVISQERNIAGKPAPDIFLEAARELNVLPGEALIVEDAQAGVTAGKKGDFRLVVGIGNASGKQELLDCGADIVVDHLGELKVNFKKEGIPADLPSALTNFSELTNNFSKRPPLLFLDFDGTLAPIVEHHDDAVISNEMRSLVKELSQKFPLAVVSGRGLSDVRKRVDLPALYYAGSHGFEISGPNGFSRDHEEAVKVLPDFVEIEPILKDKLRDVPGVDFERKKFTLAVHYRKTPVEREKEVHEVVLETLKNYPDLTKADGKKVIEIRPSFDWHKGKAVEFLKKELVEEKDPFSIYVGDDVTDEDAFKYVSNGLGILVGEHGQKTYADYGVGDIEEVKQFFRKLLDH